MPITIRKALPAEYAVLGEMTVAVYSSLAGMPRVDEQPEYYQRLRDVAKRAANPAIRIFVACDESGTPVGSVDYIADMTQYGSGGAASSESDAAGIRLLAVSPASRGQGIGKALTQFCIQQAREQGKRGVILHTTRAMETAWALYEKLGFQRYAKIDFQQGALQVFGFSLDLQPPL